MTSGVGKVGHSGVVALDVPAVLGADAVSRFRSSLEQSMLDASVRVVLLRGTAQGFCRGMDLSEISAAVATNTSPAWLRATDDFVRLLSCLREAAPITVAIVEGPALGGGVGIAAACDFVLATDAATFALPELLLGLVPAMILPVLAERFGLQKAKRWAMTQATWTAAEAKAEGLVDQQVSEERLAVETKRLLRSLCRSHPRGVAALKHLVRETSGTSTARSIELGRNALNGLLEQVEVRRDLIAFRDFGCLPGEAEA